MHYEISYRKGNHCNNYDYGDLGQDEYVTKAEAERALDEIVEDLRGGINDTEMLETIEHHYRSCMGMNYTLPDGNLPWESRLVEDEDGGDDGEIVIDEDEADAAIRWTFEVVEVEDDD
jgi:hypothetical protein